MLVFVGEHQDRVPSFHGRRYERKAVLVVAYRRRRARVSRQTEHFMRLLVLDVVVEKHHVVLKMSKFRYSTGNSTGNRIAD